MKVSRQWIVAGLFFGWWTLFGVVFGQLYQFGSRMEGKPLSGGMALTIGFMDMYSWALVALAAWWLARRIPLERTRWVRGVILHVVAALVLIVGRLALLWVLGRTVGWMDGDRPLSGQFFAVPSNFLLYSMLVGVGYAIEYYRRFQVREMASVRLEAQLADARLQALKMQLHPHFLFNTLHAISALMHRDVDAADRMIARLSDLLRITLAHEATQEVALRQELEFLQPYLEIEQTRFGDRLAVNFHVAPEALDARVPHFILQPLVENAIRHGIAPRSAPGCIEITAERSGDRLRLQVRDDGCGLNPSNRVTKGQGVGVANTRARLQQLYGDQQYFRLVGAPGGGTEAEISIPFRAATATSPNILRGEHGQDPDVDRGRRAVGAGADPYAARR